MSLYLWLNNGFICTMKTITTPGNLLLGTTIVINAFSYYTCFTFVSILKGMACSVRFLLVLAKSFGILQRTFFGSLSINRTKKKKKKLYSWEVWVFNEVSISHKFRPQGPPENPWVWFIIKMILYKFLQEVYETIQFS